MNTPSTSSACASPWRGTLRPLAALLLLAIPAAATAAERAAPPRLVLQITVDQLRGDLPRRHLPQFGPDGFRFLLEHGVVYENAHHAHANTETIVGHATLATGAHPAAHGMVGNVWFDRVSGRLVYNIEDARYPLLVEGAGVDQESEIDPTQKLARSEGRSPAALLTSTFGDELALHTAGRARIVAVSVKDRGAVSMAGHAGQAWWFSKSTGQFVTSRFYAGRIPPWVAAFNATRPADAWADRSWELLQEPEQYLFGARDDQPWETALGDYGRVFPHPFGPADGRSFTTLLTVSPVGDELTLAFALQALEHEALGQDEVTDYLSVSFSSTDYVGHLFGPSSLEAEDNLLRLDRTLATLLAAVDERVGLEHTLVVLAADHGGPEAPGLLEQHGQHAGYVAPDTWDKAPGLARLKERFGLGQELIQEYFHPYVYLDQALIRDAGLDQGEVERAVAQELMGLPGVALAVSSRDLLEGRVPDTALTRAILRNHAPRRSGDVFVVFEPHWFINDFDGLEVATTHGSPWRYDTHVPVIFAGAGLEPRRVWREIQTVDVATTLAAFVGTKPPSNAAGQVLEEVCGP